MVKSASIIIDEREYYIEGEWIEVGRRGKKKRLFSPNKIGEVGPNGIVPMPFIEQEVVFFNHYKQIASAIPDERFNDDIPTGEQAVHSPSGRATRED